MSLNELQELIKPLIDVSGFLHPADCVPNSGFRDLAIRGGVITCFQYVLFVVPILYVSRILDNRNDKRALYVLSCVFILCGVKHLFAVLGTYYHPVFKVGEYLSWVLNPMMFWMLFEGYYMIFRYKVSKHVRVMKETDLKAIIGAIQDKLNIKEEDGNTEALEFAIKSLNKTIKSLNERL